MFKYTFKELEEKILAAVQQLENDGFFGDGKDLSVLDGIINSPVQAGVGNTFELGRTLPSIAVIDNKTGQIHFFALKTLLPDLEY